MNTQSIQKLKQLINCHGSIKLILETNLNNFE